MFKRVFSLLKRVLSVLLTLLYVALYTHLCLFINHFRQKWHIWEYD